MNDTHFKDKEKINVLSHKRFNGYAGESNSWEIAQLLANEIRYKGGPDKISKEDLITILVCSNIASKSEKQVHEFTHTGCDNADIQKDNGRVTEKRICRCMNYYKSKSEQCKNCKLERKYRNNSQYKVIDYEVPCSSVMAGIGGVDLMLEKGNKQYAVEVKPPNSHESLVRMISEILTYTLDLPEKYKDANPAIAFFEQTSPTKSNRYKVADSTQFRYYKICKDDEPYKTLLSMVKVFSIRVKENAENVWDYEFIEQPEGMK